MVALLLTLTASVPWQVRHLGKCSDEIEEGPGYDHAVVDVEEEHHEHGSNADT